MIAPDHAHPISSPSSTSIIPQSARPGALIIFQELVPYPQAWALQQRVHAERVSGTRADTLVLLEHPPVYTVGGRTQLDHLGRGEAALRETGASIESVNRGGSVTYHGPGQLVGYPILSLSHHTSGPRAYVQLLEEVLIQTLALSGITGHRIAHKPGVWTKTNRRMAKIASIGVRVEHGVTLHGFALNINVDLSPFALIVPCGLEGCETTSIAELMRRPASLPLVAQQVAGVFSSVFHLEWETSA